MILAGLVFLDSIFLLYNASAPINSQDINDRRIDTYFILGYVFLLPIFGNLAIQIRWLFHDNMERRKMLILGYKIQIASMVLFCIWQIIGCHIVLGGTLSAFIIDYYPGVIGRDKDGFCVDASKCTGGTKVDLEKLKQTMSNFETSTNILWAVVQVFILCIFHNFARRMIKGWNN